MRIQITILFLLISYVAFTQTVTLEHTYYTCQFDTIFKQGILNDYWQTAAHRITPENKVDRKTVATFTQDDLINNEYQPANKKA